jgi:cellulose synthase/poly-beta-1,6-N-acetylglucosamine synthase-like glycosyltransferase
VPAFSAFVRSFARIGLAWTLPAYNPDSIIDRAVESLVQSTYPCDIYIVDDGSRTPVADLVAGSPRTTVIRLEQNQGREPSRVRRVAVRIRKRRTREDAPVSQIGVE